MEYTRFMSDAPPLVTMPWHHLQRASITTAGAKINTYVTAYGTAITVITGEKLVAIGYPPYDEYAEDDISFQQTGVFPSRHALRDYSGHKENDLVFEFVVLTPDATL